MRSRVSRGVGGATITPIASSSAAAAGVRAPRFHQHTATSNAPSYTAMLHAGGGVIARVACGSEAMVWTAATIHASSQLSALAASVQSGGTAENASCSAATIIVTPTTGTTSKFASIA